MKKLIIVITLFVIGIWSVVLYSIFGKNYGFLTSNEVKYYKPNPKKAGNYYKAQYYKTVPNYEKANPKNAPNYINANEEKPPNYYKAPVKKRPKSKGARTMEAIQSGFKK